MNTCKHPDWKFPEYASAVDQTGTQRAGGFSPSVCGAGSIWRRIYLGAATKPNSCLFHSSLDRVRLAIPAVIALDSLIIIGTCTALARQLRKTRICFACRWKSSGSGSACWPVWVSSLLINLHGLGASHPSFIDSDSMSVINVGGDNAVCHKASGTATETLQIPQVSAEEILLAPYVRRDNAALLAER